MVAPKFKRTLMGFWNLANLNPKRGFRSLLGFVLPSFLLCSSASADLDPRELDSNPNPF